MKDRPHDDAMAEFFWQDKEFASVFLDHILEEGDAFDVSVTVRQMVGQIS